MRVINRKQNSSKCVNSNLFVFYVCSMCESMLSAESVREAIRMNVSRERVSGDAASPAKMLQPKDQTHLCAVQSTTY